MKVGILTLQTGYNYGGSLQCEALQETLIGLGNDVSVINYYPVRIHAVPFWKGWGLHGKGRLSRIMRRWNQLLYLEPYEEKYNQYKKEKLRLTKPCYSPEEIDDLCADYDVLVVGSDQVWNLAYHPDQVYYLAYPEEFGGKKISYAACCGNKVTDAPEWVATRLNNLDAIAVRNSFTRDWVEEITHGERSEVEIVADPTLLHEFDLPDTIKPQQRKYILVYIIGAGDKAFHHDIIRKAKEKHGDIPVILAMATGYKIQLFNWVDEKLWMLTPYDWISWIKNAQFVYTDSFHGVLFSIKYQRDFIAYYAEAVRSPRLVTLGKDFNLSDRIVKLTHMTDNIYLRKEIDWSIVNEKIENLRSSSMDYLRRHVS